MFTQWAIACSSSGAKKCPELEFLNPLRDPLPKAPSMKMFCMYGVGAPAERSYHYQHVSQPQVLSSFCLLSLLHLLLRHLQDILLCLSLVLAIRCCAPVPCNDTKVVALA